MTNQRSRLNCKQLACRGTTSSARVSPASVHSLISKPTCSIFSISSWADSQETPSSMRIMDSAEHFIIGDTSVGYGAYAPILPNRGELSNLCLRGKCPSLCADVTGLLYLDVSHRPLGWIKSSASGNIREA